MLFLKNGNYKDLIFYYGCILQSILQKDRYLSYDAMDIGNGHGGIVSQLKYDNEMKLTDEYWINYQKGKGSEEFQKYMKI